MTIGELILSPKFNSEVTEYTATCNEIESVITAETDDPSAVIIIKVNNEAVENETAIEWASGENNVEITVTDNGDVTVYTVTVTVTPIATTLSDLTIGTLELTPAFDASESTYTTDTTNATNTITATATDKRAVIEISVNDTPHENGTAATWNEGENTVKIDIGSGTSSNSYYVTVTKS